MKLILTVGISASGKSTWAKEHAKQTGALIACRDDFRFALTGANGWPEYEFPFLKHVEQIVTSLQRQIFFLAITEGKGKNVIIADTNLNTMVRKTWIKLAAHEDIETEIVNFHISLEEAIRRDSLRGNFRVGKEVLERQYKQYQEYMRNKNG